MQFEPALLSYAGLACLALTSHRIRRDAGVRPLPTVGALQMLAMVLLSLAVWRAVHHFGVYQGPVAFVGILAAAGLPLVLMLSRSPRTALLAGLGTSAVAFATLSLDIIR